MDIEKEKARCKELIKESHSCWIGISNQKAIETVLSELDKKDKIINEILKAIIDSSICGYFIKPKCKHYAGENKKLCDECLLDYFTKKVEG